MTAGATIIALMPLALGFSKGARSRVIGDLITSTLLTLVVVPIAYEWIEKGKGKLTHIFKKTKLKKGVEG